MRDGSNFDTMPEMNETSILAAITNDEIRLVSGVTTDGSVSLIELPDKEKPVRHIYQRIATYDGYKVRMI